MRSAKVLSEPVRGVSASSHTLWAKRKHVRSLGPTERVDTLRCTLHVYVPRGVRARCGGAWGSVSQERGRGSVGCVR